MTKKKIICITCPIGCEITVGGEGDTILSMEGQGCKRGEVYARNEFMHPERILTSIVKVKGGSLPLVPVRSNKPIPKELQMACMEELRNAEPVAPVYRYDVIIPNILGTGADIVATGEVDR